MKKILITGINGYIGNVLANELKKLDNSLFICGLDISDKKDNCDDYYKCNLGVENIPDVLFENNYDCIIHAAAYLYGNNTVQSINTNCIGTKQIVDFAEKAKVKKLFFLSSIPIIGKPLNHPINEDHIIAPRTLYHMTKYIGENIIQENCKTVEYVILRIPSPVYPIMKTNKILPIFVDNALNNKDICLDGKGTRRQNYLDVRNLCKVIFNNIESLNISGVYNIASEITTSNYELAKKCIEYSNSKSNILFSGKVDNSDDEIWDIDISKAKKYLNYTEEYNVNNTIKDMIENSKK